jgi:hypothetical protein
LLSAGIAILPGCSGSAQMVSPSLDRGDEPFSYFSKPSDMIGVMDATEATEITPEGYLYTGFGELMFLAGADEEPLVQRVKTLRDGYLPVVEYTARRDGIAYQLEIFAATLNGRPDGALCNFVRVTLTNETADVRTAYFATAVRFTGPSNLTNGVGDNRFLRPRVAKRPGDFYESGEEWNPNWTYSLSGNALLRDGRILYLFPGEPRPRLSMTPQEAYNRVPDLTARKLEVQPATPVGVAQYELPLKPGESRSLTFLMPYDPVQPGTPGEAALRAADYDFQLDRTISFWNSLLDSGLEISVPEPKVVETFKASLIYDLMARDKVSDHYIQTVNKFQYHRFYLRDSADLAHMYDVSGYPEIAAQVLDFFGERQEPDGNFLSQEGQYDGWGEALLAYGQHFAMTGDRAFAAKVFPQIVRAVDWLEQARTKDPLHLMPATAITDNENVTGHITGYNFLALDGLQGAIDIAEALGKQQDAERFRRDYASFHQALFAVLDRITATTGGRIPPALDGQMDGEDWGNLLTLTPGMIFDAHDPRVTATLLAAQARYQEGIMTYGQGRWLHHYLTIKNTLTELIRGDQQQALDEFYAVLLHTSSTHAGFEYAIRPWGNRDFSTNLAPHGWFASEYRSLLRNMLVREQATDLHLLSAVSPEWLRCGESIRVRDAATSFGRIGFEVHMDTATTATMTVTSAWRRPPTQVYLHIPWFMNAASVVADGKPLPVVESQVRLPAGTRTIKLDWIRKAGTPAMSYNQRVSSYKAEYNKRYQEMLRDGVIER